MTLVVLVTFMTQAENGEGAVLRQHVLGEFALEADAPARLVAERAGVRGFWLTGSHYVPPAAIVCINLRGMNR